MSLLVQSYSHSDWAIGKAIASYLEKVFQSDFWYDKDLLVGEKWKSTILGHVAASKALVFLVSNESLKSVYCQEEIECAHKNSSEIIPVIVRRLDPALIPAWLGATHHIDVSTHKFGAKEMAELMAGINRAITAARLKPMMSGATTLPTTSSPSKLSVSSRTVSNVQIIEAGPGTGKTRSILNHVENLVSRGAVAKEILLLTFTRRTAEDMSNRIAHNYPILKTAGIQANTLHSYALQILMSAKVLAYMNRKVRILLDFETRFMIYDISVKNPKWNFNDCKKRLDAYGAAWARSPLHEPWKHSVPLDEEFYKYMMQWLILHEGLLLDELIPLALNYVTANPINSFTQTLKHVVVDEYQDLNNADQALIKQLARNAELMIVGDRNQSIYKDLRNAFPEGMEIASQDYGIPIKTLNPSYRCPSSVVSLANKLIARNSFRAAVQTVAAGSAKAGRITVVQWPSLDAEVDGIAELVNHRITVDHLRPADILVLCPAASIALSIIDILNSKYAIKAVSYFANDIVGKNLTEEFEVAEAVTLLNLLRNPEDRVSYRCWLGFGKKQLAASQYNTLIENCDVDESPKEGLRRLVTAKSPLPRSLKHLVERDELLQQRLTELQTLDLSDQIQNVFGRLTECPPQLKEVIDQEYSSIDELYEELSNLISKLDIPSTVDHVRVMSLHSSKGLEAKLVIVCGCVERLIPGFKDDLVGQALIDHHEEQRRLFYVSLTRTKDELVLSASTSMPGQMLHQRQAAISKGKNQTVLMSSFISNDLAGELHVTTGKFWLKP